MGPVTFTILNDEVDTVHHSELKPNSHIDRKRLTLLTNIWTALGASESQFLAWILDHPSMFLVSRCPSSGRLVTGISRHLVPGRTDTLDYRLGEQKTKMASGTHYPTEWLSTSTETIERHTGSGNLDCRGGQTVRDRGVGEYNDDPKETDEGTP
jgi:hypothetical protein